MLGVRHIHTHTLSLSLEMQMQSNSVRNKKSAIMFFLPTHNTHIHIHIHTRTHARTHTQAPINPYQTVVCRYYCFLCFKETSPASDDTRYNIPRRYKSITVLSLANARYTIWIIRWADNVHPRANAFAWLVSYIKIIGWDTDRTIYTYRDRFW